MTDYSRRNIIKYGGGFIGTGLAATVLGANLIKSEPATAQDPIIAQNKNITPEQALEKLMAGNARFVAQKRTSPNQTRERLKEVAEGQAPFAALLSCADSRVPAEMVFDQGLGDLFVCRIAGNIAVSEQVGSLEFGTKVLGAKVIMVLGHSSCGAVKAAIGGGRFPGQIGTLMNDLSVAVEQTANTPKDKRLEAATKANVLHQIALLSQSAIMGELIDQKQLKIVGGYYDLATGKVTLLS